MARLQNVARLNDGLWSATDVGKCFAIDCGMIGVGSKPDRESALAWISIVDYDRHWLHDTSGLPKNLVMDYRTHAFGINPQLLQAARTLEAVQLDIAQLLVDRILIRYAALYRTEAVVSSQLYLGAGSGQELFFWLVLVDSRSPIR